MTASVAGRWCQGNPASDWCGVRPYTRPFNCSAGFGLVATLTALVGVGFAGLAVQAVTQQPWDRLSPVALGALGVVAVGYAATLARSLQLAAQTG